MIISLLILNTIIFLSTSLGILMFNNNLKKISKSIHTYLDPKAYKPANQVAFISLLMDKYQCYEDKSSVDLDSFIKDSFYNNNIGKFKTSKIETLASKGKGLLWISTIIMMLYEMISVGLGESSINSIWIIISICLGLILVAFDMYVDINMGKKKLFLKINNHINNEYPQFQVDQKEKEEVALLLNKIDQLEAKIKSGEEIEEKQKREHKKETIKQEEILQEEDIAQILMSFDLF